MLLAGSLAAPAVLTDFGRAHGLAAPSQASHRAGVDRADSGWTEMVVHNGPAPIGVKWFASAKAAAPHVLLSYLIAPGAGEGVHVHRARDPVLGAYDEFYYVAEGSGVMDIGGDTVPVSAGDHVFTPMGVPHGVRNIAERGMLRIVLTAIAR